MSQKSLEETGCASCVFLEAQAQFQSVSLELLHPHHMGFDCLHLYFNILAYTGGKKPYFIFK